MSLSTTEQAACKCRIANDFQILINSPVFRNVSPDIVKLFAYFAKHKIYYPGDTLIRQGKDADRAFLLLHGSVALSTLHKEKDTVIQHLHEGSFFGELALLADFKWFFSAKAETECEVLTVDRESFTKVLEKHPEKQRILTDKIIQLRVARLSEQTEYMLNLIPQDQLDKFNLSSPIIA